MAAACIGSAVAMAMLPLVANGYVMVATRILGGFAMGFQDTVPTARLFEIWGDEGGPWFQMTHFMFAFGGIISPLTTKPFLAQTLGVSDTEHDNNETETGDTTTQYSNSDSNGTPYSLYTSTTSTADGRLTNITETAMITETFGESYVHYAYLISALITALTAVPFIILYVIDKQEHEREKSNEQTPTDDKETVLKLPRKWTYTLVALMSVCMMVAMGYIDMFPNYLTSFGILQVGATKGDGSSATSIHFATYAGGNLVGAILQRYISSGKLLTIYHVATVVAFLLYYLSIRLQLTTLIQWSFIGISGVAISSIIPTMYTWTQDHVTPISGLVASVYLVSGSLGVMMTPMFLGYLMENVTPMWFLYIIFIYEGICIVCFVAAVIIVTYAARNNDMNATDGRDQNVQINPAFQHDSIHEHI